MALRSRLADLLPLTFAPSTNGTKAAALAPAEQKAVPTIDPRIYAQFVPIDSAGHTQRVGVASLDWYSTAWLPYACMRYRATKLIEAPLWIAEEQDGGEEWLEGDHPLADLLETPNPDMEMADLLELVSLYLDSTGAALLVKSRDRSGRVGALYPFSGEDFRVETADGRLFGRFRVKTTGGEQVYGPDDVVHFRNASPADPHGCVAPLHAALARLGIDRTLVESIAAGLRNAIVPGMVLSFPAEAALTQEQQQEFKASLAAGYETARNHGKSLVVGGGVTASRLPIGFKDLNGGELAKEVEAAVCACFQTPPAIIGAYVGLENSSDRHNMETAVRMFYDNAMLPTWARMEKALTRSLLRPVDPNPLRFIRFDKTKIAALQEDMGAKSEIAERSAAFLTINERRVLLGFEALDGEEGDRLSTPAAPAADPDPVKRSPHPSQRKAEGGDPDLRWSIFDQVTRAQELGWQLAAAAQLEEDRDAVLRIMDAAKGAAGPAERKDDDPAGAEYVRRLVREVAEHMDATASARWAARIAPLVESTARQAAERASVELGVSFDLLQPGLVEYVQREASWLVTQVTDTTKQAVRDALAAGLVEGESIPQLAKRIEESGAFARSRAELIARTETTRVTNGGQRESLARYQADTGDRITKTWLATPDGRTRDAHRALNGESRPVAEAFSNGLQEPSEPNCRCTMTFSLEGGG